MEEVTEERVKKEEEDQEVEEWTHKSSEWQEHPRKQSTMEFLIFRLLGGFKAGSKCMEEAVSQLLQLSQQDAHASLGFCHVVLKNLR